jgi:hypothetical protein
LLNEPCGSALLDLRVDALLPVGCSPDQRKRHLRLELPLYDKEWFYTPAFGVFREFAEKANASI